MLPNQGDIHETLVYKPEASDEEDRGQRPSGEEDDDGGADGLVEEGGHVGGREEVLQDEGEGELGLGSVRLAGRGFDAAEHVASATNLHLTD